MDIDSKPKEEALRNKAIMEGLINEDVESNNEASEDACQAYQEIFRMMDEGWMVTRDGMYETEKALRNNQVYNWETTKYDMALPPRDQRHEWLRFDIQGYPKEEKQEFETRLANIYYRKIHQIEVLDFDRGVDGEDLFMSSIRKELLGICGPLAREFQLGGLRRQLDMRQLISVMGLHTEEEMQTEGFRAYWEAGLRRIVTKADLVDYWARIASDCDFLGPPPSYEPLRRYAWGRREGGQMSGGHFIAQLGIHFGVITEQSLQGLTVKSVGLLRVRQGSKLELRALQMPQAAIAAPRTISQRYSAWMVDRIAKLMQSRGMRFERFDGRIDPDTHLQFEQHKVKQRTDGASTLA
ncbi:hypothetical protein Tco_0967595 [Tanacetum coccineum]